MIALFGIKIRAPKFLRKAVKSVGSAVSDAGSAVGSVAQGAAKATVNATVTGLTTPIKIGVGIARGERIDKVALKALNENIKVAKEIAPYAQTVVSMVPGVGSGVSGAISAGMALANGQGIDDAIIAGVKGSLPGGPLAQSAFSVATDVMAGKPIDTIAVNALPLTPEQKRITVAALKTAKAIADGRPVSTVAIDTAMNQLPPDARKALQVGIAVSQGKRIKPMVFAAKILKSVPKVMPKTPQGPALLVSGTKNAMVGVQVADSIVKQYNNKTNPQARAKARVTVKNTKLLAAKGKTPAIRRAAANGLTLMRKRAAALKLRKKYRVETRGKNRGKVVKVR
jgi:hypothetical protein